MDLENLRKQFREKKESKHSVKVRFNKFTIPDINHDISEEAENHYNLALCYDNGLNGYEEDTQKAYDEYLKAAELGHPHAMIEVGQEYVYNCLDVLGRDLDKARFWGNKALEIGNMDGYSVLAACEDSVESEKLLDLGISKGSQSCVEDRAQNLIYGYEYPDGHIIEEDDEKAFNYLKNINWDKYHTYGLKMLGDLYRKRGNLVQAINSYKRILELDPQEYDVMYTLGDIFRTEEDVKDLAQAKILFLESARLGNITAMNDLGVMLYNGEECEQDIPEALNWLKKAAQNGLHQAMINLYDILIDENRDEAWYWLNRAVKEGSEEAKNRLREIQNEEGTEDLSRSDKIYNHQLSNLENTLNLSTYDFLNRLSSVQKVIDDGGLSDYESDRLRLLMGVLSLLYFKQHFGDDDFEEDDQRYYEILDKVDDYVKEMTSESDEADYLYYLANMYSADRFSNDDPLENLEEFWDKMQEIDLNDTHTEFKVSFWEDTAQEVYDLMSDLLDSSSALSDDFIKNKVIQIISNTLSLDIDKVHSYSRIQEDLGAHSRNFNKIKLIMNIEEEFDLTIPDKEIKKFRTVGDIICFIKIHS